MPISYSWTILEGTPYEERLFGLSKGSDGFLYAVGWTKGDFGEDSISSVNKWDSYLLKADTNGNVEWTKLLGSNSSTFRMSVDASQADLARLYQRIYDGGDSDVTINYRRGRHDEFSPIQPSRPIVMVVLVARYRLWQCCRYRFKRQCLYIGIYI